MKYDPYRNQLNCDTWDTVDHFRRDMIMYFQTHHDTRTVLELKHTLDRTSRKWQLTADE